MRQMRGQDIPLLLKLLLKKSSNWTQTELASELGLSQAEVAKGLHRLKKAGLVQGRRANRSGALEFLKHGLRYVWPAELGPLVVGIPTATSAPAFESNFLNGDEDIYVWPSSKGTKRGQAIKPLYPKLAEAALKDQEFYELLSAVEILRVGRARERKVAEEYLNKKVKQA